MTHGAPRGRRAENDEAWLVLMAQFNAQLISRGEQPNDRDAARNVVKKFQLQGAKNTDIGSVEDRLRGKFRRRRDELMASIELIPKREPRRCDTADERQKVEDDGEYGVESNSERGF